MLSIDLKSASKVEGVLNARTFYAPDVAVTAGAQSTFDVEVPGMAGIKQAWLELCVQRDEGLDENIRGSLNGHAFEIDTRHSRGVDRFWEPLQQWIPISHLKPGA